MNLTHYRPTSSLNATTLVTDWPSYLAIAILSGTLFSFAGTSGLIVATLTAITWLVLGVPGAIAIGHIALVAIVDPTLTDIAIAEVGFVSLVLATAIRDSQAMTTLIATTLALIVFATIAIGATTIFPMWTAASLLIVTIAVSMYFIHRIGLVHLGLIHGGETA